MTRILSLIILSALLLTQQINGEPVKDPTTSTLRQKIEDVKTRHGVKFVYDSSLLLDIPYRGKKLDGLTLDKSLAELFRNTGLRWEKNGDYVIIMPAKKYTLSGYVTEPDGETVINATVLDITSGAGTLTNEHGFFSLTLPEGHHSVSFSSIGNSDRVEDIMLSGNKTLSVVLSPGNELEEVVVTADLNSPLHTTQTGKISLTAKDLNREYALLSSPDVVKTLQTLSGVAAGTEITSGLYVHGGDNDQNLFMLDGTPLYQVNHLGGLFSSFNTDVIKNIDFYKSGFPARYGGQLSSVVDVRTKDGNMNEYHGSFSVGLLDGRLQIEGPIARNRTSFNIGLRRTWLDLITIPAFAIYNKNQKGENTDIRYAFHDFNAKVTHIFSPRSRADISFFSGNDTFRAKDTYEDLYQYRQDEYSKINLQWGNMTAAMNWKYQFSPKLYSVFTAIYTYNKSRQGYIDNYNTYTLDSTIIGITHVENHSRSTINDFGARMELDYRLNQTHHIRTGANYLMHFFKPQSFAQNNFSGNGTDMDTTARNIHHTMRGHELSVYAEDNIALGERWRVNAGIHCTLFNIPDKTYGTLEPRLAVRYQASDRVTLKASYTKMSQYMHQLSNSYLNLPTDYWVPSTAKIAPSRSQQYAAGVYLMLPRNIRLSAEGFYKTMENLIEYDGGNSLTPPFENWDSRIRRGRGRAYGMEIEGGYGNERLSISGSYTLSWNERNFPGFHSGWYPDKFDNRHKLNINLSYKITNRIDAYAAWSFHSGNRMTVPQQITLAPTIPVPGGAGHEYYELSEQNYIWVYEKPNNISLAAYHRLDLGINFRRTTKKGNERIWNISVYNAYCRMNPFTAKIVVMPNGTYRGKATAIFPILPSFSYTYKF
ncbi:TonB-dependent receptor [uncultured Duncaniella sp.]|uniref:TonB-dependent receptor n=1 Tax=uncultured Duncaniella sp. TaxID=2768039 RepID=UPI0025A591BA|nr:TonB-dependent receptor [uncultured Duncaniella sp.]